MTDSIETSDREAEEPRMLRLPVVEMAAEPAPPPVAAGYEPHPVGTGERIRFLERVNAEMVDVCLLFARWVQAGQDFRYPPGALQQLTAALTSATKEQP